MRGVFWGGGGVPKPPPFFSHPLPFTPGGVPPDPPPPPTRCHGHLVVPPEPERFGPFGGGGGGEGAAVTRVGRTGAAVGRAALWRWVFLGGTFSLCLKPSLFCSPDRHALYIVV